MEIFTDGSSFVRDGKRKAGYAVVTAEQVLEAKSLPQETSVQLAELVALTRALELIKGQWVNIYTDSKYAYLTLHTQCCTYIPDMSTNVTHFTKHMNKMIGAMDTPEASIASLWETLTSSPWGKSILITIILIVLFLLFAPCICNCVTGFVSIRMKAFKLQMVAQTPAITAASPDYYLGPLDQTSSL